MDSIENSIETNSGNSEEQNYKVKNIGAIIGSLFLVAIFAVGFLLSLIARSIGFSVFLLILSLISFLRFRVIKEGISFDIANGKMSYPGGGVALNKISDIFNPKFVFQYFHRFVIPMDEIRSISSSRDTMVRQNSNNGNISTIHTYYIEVNGKFGSSKISFGANEQKRDEAYSFIRQHNRMGSPITFG